MPVWMPWRGGRAGMWLDGLVIVWACGWMRGCVGGVQLRIWQPLVGGEGGAASERVVRKEVEKSEAEATRTTATAMRAKSDLPWECSSTPSPRSNLEQPRCRDVQVDAQHGASAPKTACTGTASCESTSSA
eukprot:1723667-Pleurochrysis_carterae.AAC.4